MKSRLYFHYCFLLGLLFLHLQKGFGQYTELKVVQSEIRQALHKSFNASVFLIDYIPGPLVYEGFRSSGVIVRDGYILTAGHATIIGKKYRVVFPDGKECTATGWSKIRDLDIGVLIINEKGDWPFAEMGWTSSLKDFEPCISIAYPGSFQPKELMIRFGYITEVHSMDMPGMMRTTCVMEPGDSGGPVFDLLGRVIGIRSKIYISVRDNFDVPIAQFRKYWSSLIKGGEFSEHPAADEIPPDPLAKTEIKGVKDLESNIHKEEKQLDEFAVRITSRSVAGETLRILGTPISSKRFQGLFKNGKGLIVSKNSMVGDSVIVILNDGKEIPANVLFRNDDQDLVLLQVNHSFRKQVNPDVTVSDSTIDIIPGHFIFSPIPENEVKLSVIGTQPFSINRTNTSKVIFGASLEKISNKMYFQSASGPAAIAGLQAGDELISIDGVRVADETVFADVLKTKSPDEVVTVVTMRNNQRKSSTVRLMARKLSGKPGLSQRFKGGMSDRRNGFHGVFAHDGNIEPAECGGPVFDLNNKFIGINIARYSRTSSLALTSFELKKFIEGVR